MKHRVVLKSLPLTHWRTSNVVEIYLILWFLLACGGRFTSVNGRFTSPGYPRNYPNYARCRYVIRVPYCNRIELRFEYFNLEQGYDKVRIMQMDSGLLVDVANVTGYGSTERKFVSVENVFILLFTSDGSVTSAGFTARYNAIHTGR